jgi:predicted CXXCH cytochrome family protein
MRILSRHVGLGMLAAASLLLAAPGAMAAISGSKHDFSTSGWSGGQVCVACHAPHNNTNAAGNVLWNHALTTATYTLYSSPTMNATGAAVSGVSKLCLSCHDGTVALDSFGGTIGTNFITASANLNSGASSLTNDHPIGITYDAALVTADGGLKAITSAANIGPGGAKTGTIDSNLLNGGKVECSSCHDVHNANTAVTADLLKISTSGSALCLACHVK